MEWGNVAQIGGVLISLVAFVTAMVSAFGRKTDEKIDSVAERNEEIAKTLGEIMQRLATVERDVQHMPDKETAHRMEMAIARLEGRLETIDERLKPVAAITNRMQELLIEKGRG